MTTHQLVTDIIFVLPTLVHTLYLERYWDYFGMYGEPYKFLSLARLYFQGIAIWCIVVFFRRQNDALKNIRAPYHFLVIALEYTDVACQSDNPLYWCLGMVILRLMFELYYDDKVYHIA